MADENSPMDAQNLLSEDAAGPSEEEWTEEEEETIAKPATSAGVDLDSRLDFLRSLITVDTPTPPAAPPTYDEEDDEEEEQQQFYSSYPDETTGEEEDDEEEGFYTEHEYNNDNEIVELFSPLTSPDGNYTYFEQEMTDSLGSDDVDEEALDEYEAEEGDEDTIPKTGNVKQTESDLDITLAPTTGGDLQSSAERPSPKNKKDMSKRSFRWFERQLLYPLIPKPSDEGRRRKQLLEKCQMVRKVSKPVVTLLGAPKSFSASQDVGQGSNESLNETDVVTKSFKDFTNFAWAMKNTQDFLTNAGCTESSSRTYRSSLKAVKEDVDIRLKIYEKQLKRRRKAIGSREQAPEITAALLRHAQRAVWRAVIDNTKPRYPLPRFIFTRHRYLKRVQAQFIGPGSYEHDVFHSQTKARQQKMPSTWATCNPRFPKDPAEASSSSKGGVGAVHLLDPWESLDKANYQKKYPGTYIPFESTPQNFRKSTEAGSKIPPNAYNIKSPLEEFIKQKTSLRGPYDCYTPSRAVIPYGHYQTTTDEDKSRLGPGSYEVRSSLVKEMNDPYNFFKAKFGKAERNKMFGFKAAFDKPLWPKDNGIPPVGHYEGDTEIIGKDRRQYKAPFKILAGLKKRDDHRELVAPDYYYFNGTWTVPPKGADLASVFHSKSPQIMPSKLHQVRKERNRAMNRFCDPLGRHKEEHYAYDVPVKNDYVLEDCKYQCSGPRVDPFAIPGHGVANAAGKSGCCGCG